MAQDRYAVAEATMPSGQPAHRQIPVAAAAPMAAHATRVPDTRTSPAGEQLAASGQSKEGVRSGLATPATRSPVSAGRGGGASSHHANPSYVQSETSIERGPRPSALSTTKADAWL